MVARLRQHIAATITKAYLRFLLKTGRCSRLIKILFMTKHYIYYALMMSFLPIITKLLKFQKKCSIQINHEIFLVIPSVYQIHTQLCIDAQNNTKAAHSQNTSNILHVKLSHFTWLLLYCFWVSFDQCLDFSLFLFFLLNTYILKFLLITTYQFNRL